MVWEFAGILKLQTPAAMNYWLKQFEEAKCEITWNIICHIYIYVCIYIYS